ncbi:hypothetical protein VOLCADRAFT_107395 [Volvox carteri f. nagariensis]|uniref:peptidylprolyl isomerase n=1 Tax=Volvox carteri f. nagariensis TaxID=3068 RepID=D8UDR2_VOLCA|nr:uncharacterized protein VOLCADRAFT_107395 [Volvox carteri f. nagariensis]EFJ42139.1 hypothetical protein VOLCADRAFT_107395 [Volvox carteri f. nagariensis]|eukprot:XP_002956836.1 hypothetical protein VOLCADRAFT_107395 [Volvox carteri f. nagariensis]
MLTPTLSSHTRINLIASGRAVFGSKSALSLPLHRKRQQLLLVVARSAPESSSQQQQAEVAVADPDTTVLPKQPSLSAADVSAAPVAAPVTAPVTVTAASNTVAGSVRPVKRPAARQAESTDAVATFLTRRFGIAGGLAWLGFLAIGTLGEQIKTRMEVANEINGTKDVENAPEVVLPSGLRYRDLRVGGGQSPLKGYLVVLDYIATADGVQFESTRARGKPIVFLYGSRPYTGGMCAGLEQALASMKAGGRRIVTVPPELGFGERGAVLRPTEHVPDKQGIVPPAATLVYDVELVRVSIPPS